MEKVELLFIMLFLDQREGEKDTSLEQIKKILLNAHSFYFKMASLM